ncbi:MAG: outer envelope protein [Burkholderiales bacterium]|nr:outer envelope protein [Burkholderiales bacterium]MDE1927955.1 outer envelope protein [Burkholderiales bacterium]MDE2502881.1 outer envelope protein [Burkholderiales bacterium]
MKINLIGIAAASAALATFALSARAADWSDTSVGLRTGNKFAEPYGSTSIGKTILDLNHVSGYKYGTNFFNVDLLMSDGKDPAGGVAGQPGAQEAYLVYRNTFDLSKITGSPIKFGPLRTVGITAGFDLNTKNDFYASKKRMLVLGPTFEFDVPGFLNLSAYLLDESNAPNGLGHRYTYKTHGALEADWGIPLGSLPLSFSGYAQWIQSKGTNEFGGATAAETHVDMMVMLDVGAATGTAKNTFKIGVEYEYWKNKFGNPTTSAIGPGAGPGATAKTPMLRVEYHF